MHALVFLPVFKVSAVTAVVYAGEHLNGKTLLHGNFRIASRGPTPCDAYIHL